MEQVGSSDTKRGDQIREGQAGAAETGSIRVLKKSLYPHLSICVCLLRRLQNVVGDTRLRLRPENVEMILFLKYNLRAINYPT